MQLKLKRSKATALELREATEEESKQDSFDLEHRTIFKEGIMNEFVIEFRLRLTMEKSYHLSAQYASTFETDTDFNDEFKQSSFAKINAPAIAFPFIRSYIAHITLMAGFDSVILPTVNFTLESNGVTTRPADQP